MIPASWPAQLALIHAKYPEWWPWVSDGRREYGHPPRLGRVCATRCTPWYAGGSGETVDAATPALMAELLAARAGEQR